MLVGLTLALISFVLYCPFALASKVYAAVSVRLKHLRLMVQTIFYIEKVKESEEKLVYLVKLQSLYELISKKLNCLHPM